MKKKLLVILLLGIISLSFTGCLPTRNYPPVITTTTLPNAVVGTEYTATVEATDADGDELTFSLVSGPTGMVISEDGVISGWTPTEVGTQAITVAVTDGTDSVSADFTIEVIALDTPNRVVMVELYIQVNCPHCTIVEPILEQLAEDYGPLQMLLLEEHLWGDGYDTSETNARYNWYIPLGKGTPDALFNGLNTRRQGSSYNYSDYQSIIDRELAKEAKINISAWGEKSPALMSVSGSIKNISSSNLENLEISGMIFEDRGSNGLRYLVLDIFEGQEVSLISPKETIEFSFSSENLNWQNSSKVHAVIFVQAPDSSTKEILQALYVN